MNRRITASAAMAGLLANVFACGSDSDKSPDMNGSEIILDDTPANPAGPVGAGNPASPGSTVGGGQVLGGSEIPAEGAPGSDPGEPCAGLVLEAETLTYVEPVMMYIVLDNSKSMIEGAKDGESTKWEQAVNAFTEFARDPTSAGIDIGIQYFNPSAPPSVVAEHEARVAAAALDPNARPPRDLRYRPDECDGIAHAQSAMEVGRLPAAADSFIQSLAEADPRSNTPTVGALTGGVNFCKEFQLAHPKEECVLVFVTDGQPNGCGLGLGCSKGLTPNALGQCTDPESEGILSPIVQEAYDNHGVRTYTVGMNGVNDDGFDLLNTLARIGGTDCTPNTGGEEACDVSVTGGAGLLEALNLIRDTITEEIMVACTWALPDPPDGKLLNPEQVNVGMSLRGADIPLGRVTTEAECALVEGGWYYDVPAVPTEIRTCPQTCDIVLKNPDDVRVNLQFGCATRPAVAR